MPGITIKNVTPDLLEALRELAAEPHRSLNGEVILALRRAVLARSVDSEQTGRPDRGGQGRHGSQARERCLHPEGDTQGPSVSVFDTNVIAAFHLRSDSTREAYDVMRSDADRVAPALWRSGFRKGLVNHLRCGLLLPDWAVRLMTAAEPLLSGNEHDVTSAAVIDLAAASGCIAYDSKFVALALAARRLAGQSSAGDRTASPGRFSTCV